MSLKICMLASEVTPFAKTGGLADVAGALTKFLHATGHDVRLFMPQYSHIGVAAHHPQPVAALQNLQLEFGGHRFGFSVATVTLPKSAAPLFLIQCDALFARGGVYSQDRDEHLRFIAFSRAVLDCCQRLAWAPDIVHSNDWHTAFAPLFLKSAYAWDALFKRTRTVMTIHNIGYQGVFAAGAAGDLGLNDKVSMLHQDDLRTGKINALRHGIIYADAITTVSPTYAREILTDQYGMGLQGDLRARTAVLSGILNGVDYDDWNPRTDKHLPKHFDASQLQVKAELKAALLQRLRLPKGPKTALLGLISRMTVQKGFDLLFESLPRILEQRDLCLVAVGNGDAHYENFFANLQRRMPRKVVYHRGYNEDLAHWIEAASDMFLMPSLYEPCGLNQMYSLRYGTIPIVRKTGGLADSVQMFDRATGLGTGVVFNDFNTAAVEWAIATALELFHEPLQWNRLVQNAMACDFSWDRQGAQYVALYNKLAAT